MNMAIQENAQKYCATIDQLIILRQLGAGFTSSVYLVKDQQGNHYAAKKFHQDKVTKYFENQINIMKAIQQHQGNQNIIAIQEVRQNATITDLNGKAQNCCVILMQYANGGELYDYIAYTGKFSQRIARVYFRQLINAVKYMKDLGIAHRDMKPENILLTRELILKITDFGFSCFTEDKILSDNLGSAAYKAPQIFKKQYNGYKVDLFAIGAILFTMVVGTNPFSSVSDIRYRFISQKNYKKFWKTFEKQEKQTEISDQFKQLFMCLVAYDPAERLSVEQILQHPWMQMPVQIEQNIYKEFQSRLITLQKIRQKKILLQKQKRQRLMQANSPLINRCPEIHSNQDKIIQIYHQQLNRLRQLVEIKTFHEDDIVLQQNHAVIVTFLKDLLQNRRQSSDDSDQSHSQNIVIIKQLDDQIRLRYTQQQQISGHEESVIVAQTALNIKFGMDKQHRFVMSFRDNIGCQNQLYYKKKIREIKQLYYYCMASDTILALSFKIQ